MIEELFDKITVAVAYLISSEAARPFIQRATRPPNSENNVEEKDDGQFVEVDSLDLATTAEQGHTNTIKDYGSIPIHAPDEQPRTFLSSCKTSLFTSFTITAAVLPVSLAMISVLYIHVNTSGLCLYQQRQEINDSLPEDLIKYVIAGHDIESFFLNFWFQFMLILLFGWKKFKSRYFSTLLLSFILGLTVVVYKTTLFKVNIDFTQTKYKYPSNAVFLFGVIYSSYIVAKKVSETFSTNTRRLRKRKVFLILSTQFFFGFLIAMGYKYLFVRWFRDTKSGILQAIIAMATPTLALLPVVISENLALQSLSFIKEGHTFLLVYFVNGVSLLLYCIMQAGVQELSLFIGLSVFRGALQVFQTATVKIRQKVVIGIWKCLERKCTSCPQLGEVDESSHHRRLKVDKEIQIMLYQSTAIILSQAYLVLYLTSFYQVAARDILEEFIMKRVLIGIGMSFVANCVSIFIHIYWHNAQITKAWYSHWRLHLLALTLGGVMSVCFFTQELLSVFDRFADSKKYHMKDCKDPF